mmetsp:Transcript_21612/g.26035  ORF Transcript_21612/g.26035 Transcript_21612/m.26035 type:complete len:501 (-) Transcript_21612:572-2074(-)|eukprot:CAMPEP_0197843666 /NCGR_PEP_ID=MMETSP1438-20131217/576_1 /TAXON_ID=1461541 /ORGANISM="Pterosperma sp., Strain CCMP1384" /LENGTH=500 /DNA_ID=CAMNT_0043453967 /DNA_START=591 /DNA_END=2093 /DNA_ORIENTATION=-
MAKWETDDWEQVEVETTEFEDGTTLSFPVVRDSAQELSLRPEPPTLAGIPPIASSGSEVSQEQEHGLEVPSASPPVSKSNDGPSESNNVSSETNNVTPPVEVAEDVKDASCLEDISQIAVDDNPEFHEATEGKNFTFVLVGKSGNGKSATGNMLLGREAFQAKNSPSSVTRHCQKESTVLTSGDTLSIIDTPGLFDTSASVEEVQAEITSCVRLAPEGIHGLLVVLTTTSRFTAEEASAVKRLKDMFGSKLLDFAVLVFTHGDMLMDDDDDDDDVDNIEDPSSDANSSTTKAKEALAEYLSGAPPDLQEVLLGVHARTLLFDNTVVKKRTRNETKRRAQVQALLEMINDLMAQHGDATYSELLYREMQRTQEEATRRLLEDENRAAEEAEREQLEYARKIQRQMDLEWKGVDDDDVELAGLQRDLKHMEARMGDRVEARVAALEAEIREAFETKKAEMQQEVLRAQRQAEEAQRKVEKMRAELEEQYNKRPWWERGCAIM